MKIDLTESAKEQILKENKGDKYIRLYIKNMSWAGPTFGLSLDETIKDTDVLKELEGIKFIVDDHIENTYRKIVVDYGDRYFRKGYIVEQDR